MNLCDFQLLRFPCVKITSFNVWGNVLRQLNSELNSRPQFWRWIMMNPTSTQLAVVSLHLLWTWTKVKTRHDTHLAWHLIFNCFWWLHPTHTRCEHFVHSNSKEEASLPHKSRRRGRGQRVKAFHNNTDSVTCLSVNDLLSCGFAVCSNFSK